MISIRTDVLYALAQIDPLSFVQGVGKTLIAKAYGYDFLL
jgi:hypothetical protein